MNDVWLAKRKGKRGTTYSVRWIDPDTGKARCKSLGRDRAAAEGFRAQKRKNLRTGVRDEVRPVTWAEFVTEDAQLRAKQVKSETIEGITKTLLDFGAVCGVRTPLDVTARKLERYQSHLRQTCKEAPRTVNRKLAFVGGALRRAREWEYLVHPPVLPKRARVKCGLLRILDAAERARLLAACPDIRWRVAVLLGLKAGLRRDEIIRLAWERLHLDRGEVDVVDSKGHDRVIPLAPGLVTALRELQAGEARIGGRVLVRTGVHSRGRGWTRHHFNGTFQTIRKAAGVVYCRPHDLRRTFITDLAASGVNEVVCQKLAGHTSITTTAAYYTAVRPETMRTAIDRLPRESVA